MWRHNTLTQLPERLVSEQTDAQEDTRPFELNTGASGSFVDIAKDRLTAKYSGAGQHGTDVGAIQTSLPVPRQSLIYYFEMTVQDKGEKGRITLGFTVKDSKLSSQPGWEPNTYGYHGDDGRKYSHPGSNLRANTGSEYGPTFSTGDTVGAGLNLETQEMFFTKNGKLLGTAFRNVPLLRFYPTIGMHSRNEAVTVNLGASTFAFDLQSQLDKGRQQRQDEVESVSISPGHTHHIIQDYLRHYGYADTLYAFDQAAGLNDSVASTSGRPEKEAQQLATRQKVRRAIMAGQVSAAQDILHQSHPDMLESVTHPNLDVLIFFHCLHYIELIRERRINDAVRFAQETLLPLRGIMAHRSSEYDAMLHDTVALIAYEEPEESPMCQLLDNAQRQVVADVVNAALLAAATGKPKWEVKPQAHLEQILRQLVAVHAEKLHCNGGQGEVFKLQKHIAAPQPSHDGVESMTA